MSDYAYGKTPLGQLVYDLLFTNLSEKYLARKHRMPIAEVRRLRATAKAAYRGRKRKP
jgi:hypothetical protein